MRITSTLARAVCVTAALALSAVAASAATIADFDLTWKKPRQDQSYSYENNSVGLTISAGTYTFLGGPFAAGNIHQSAAGTGVKLWALDSSSIDGAFLLNDVVFFDFGTTKIDQISFDFTGVTKKDEYRMYVDFGAGLQQYSSGALANSLTFGGLGGVSYLAFGSGPSSHSAFRISGASVTTADAPTPAPVPLPAAGLLLAGGLGAMGVLRRRRKA